MFSLLPRLASRLLSKATYSTAAASTTTQTNVTRKLVSLGAVGLASATYLYFFSPKVSSSADVLHPPAWPWYHKYLWRGFDHASIRRGFQVYMMVGNNCHSLEYISFRHLINVAFTEKEMKAIAAEYEVEDGPNETGEMFSRPRTTQDHLPRPYANEQQARFTNNGALPPDLTLMRNARPDGEDYIFSLMTGYCPPPAGLKVPENMYYNPYFPGGFISMPPPLVEGMIDFEDGTEASISQMAKDLCSFLTWSAEPTLEERHKFGVKAMMLLTVLIIPLNYWNKLKWSIVKNRKVSFLRKGKDAFY
eukprot:TRINITY_DN826_c0_g1_i1.p1 TRINITY_DN826_c0_g1~~TRINITY_DN826_c0_g1_i1.p1  ORF type:complete len:305 (+),score=47.87 TRINITY_DN826_c0_g1_i1:82-996(+)